MAAEKKEGRTVATRVTDEQWTKLSLAAMVEQQKSVGSYLHLLIERALEDKQTVGRVREYFGITDEAKAPATKAAATKASPTTK
jgi:hypothetical protein